MNFRQLMLTICIIILRLFSFPTGSGSPEIVESITTLQQDLKEKSGRSKIDVLVRLSELMTETTPAAGLKYAEQAARLSKQYGYIEGEADALRQMGIIYSFWGDNNESLKYYARSTAMSSKCDDAGRMVVSFTLIGRALLSSGEIDRAEQYYRKGMEVIQSAGRSNKNNEIEPHLVAAVYDGLADALKRKNNYIEAIAYYRQALALSEKAKNKELIAHILLGIGESYAHRSDFDKSISSYFKALQIYKELGRQDSIASALSYIGELYIYKNQFQESYRYLEKAGSIAREINSTENLMEIYHHYILLYSRKGNYKKAFEYHKLYSNLNESLNAEKKQKQIAAMKATLEIEKNKRENAILKKNNEIQSVIIDGHRRMRKYMFLAFGLLITLIWFMYRRYLYKKKANRLLSESNLKISRQKEELKKTLDQLTKSENKIQTIFDNALSGLGLMDREERYINVNNKWLEMLGYPREQLLNKKCETVTHPDDIVTTKEHFRALLEGEIKHFSIEKRYLRKDGSYFWGSLSATPLYASDNTVESIIFMVIDISLPKKAEAALKESEEKYRNLVEHAKYGIVIAHNNNIEFVNTKFSRMTGYEKNQLIGTTFTDYIFTDEGKTQLENLMNGAIGQNGEEKIETVLATKAEENIDVELAVSEIYYGQQFRDLIFVHDTTFKKLLEKETKKTREQRLIWNLAKRMIKEIGVTIGEFSDTLETNREALSSHRVTPELNVKARETAKKISEFSFIFPSLLPGRRTRREAIYFQEKLPEWLEKIPVNPDFKIILKLPTGLWPVDVHLNQFQTVIINMLKNTADSLDIRRTLTIEAENTTDDFREQQKAPPDRIGSNEFSTDKFIKITCILKRDDYKKVNPLQPNVDRLMEIMKPREVEKLRADIALLDLILKNHGGRYQMGPHQAGIITFELYLPAGEAVENQAIDSKTLEN